VYLGTAARRAGDVPAARAALGEALAIYDELGNCSGKAAALNEMGALQRLCGAVGQAESLHRYALELAILEQSAWDEAHARAGVARCALAGGAARTRPASCTTRWRSSSGSARTRRPGRPRSRPSSPRSADRRWPALNGAELR
jgi:hypothetical protein